MPSVSEISPEESTPDTTRSLARPSARVERRAWISSLSSRCAGSGAASVAAKAARGSCGRPRRSGSQGEAAFVRRVSAPEPNAGQAIRPGSRSTRLGTSPSQRSHQRSASRRKPIAGPGWPSLG